MIFYRSALVSLMLINLLGCSSGYSSSPPSDTSKFMQRHEELQKRFQSYNEKLADYEKGLKSQLDEFEKFEQKRRKLILLNRQRKKREEAAAAAAAVPKPLDNPSVKLLDTKDDDEAAAIPEEVSTTSPLTPLSTIQATDLHDLYFQLTEHEDDFSCITEVLMRRDGYVDIGVTDGPRPKETSGTWRLDEHSHFVTIDLHRKFGMGDYNFYVARTFTGAVGRHDDDKKLLGVEGTAQELDPVLGNTDVGTFAMVDITHLRKDGMKYEIPPRKGVDSFAFWRTKLVYSQ